MVEYIRYFSNGLYNFAKSHIPEKTEQGKFILRSNFITLFVFFLVPIFIPIFIWLNAPIQSLSALGVFLSGWIILKLNARYERPYGRIVQLLSFGIWLFYFTWVFGENSSTHFLYLAFAVIPLLLFPIRQFAFYLGFFVIYLLLFWYLESDLINFSGMLKAAEQERLQVIVFNLLFLWVFANFWFYNRSTELYERDLEQALQKIEAKNEELEQFVHIASHDLQEPLQSITSFIEIAQQEEHKTREEELQYLDYMQVAAKRMRSLILALMNYSRIGRGQKPKQLTDLNQMALSLKTEFENQWEEGELSIEVDALPKLKVYAEELRILFEQLLSNAIKFREGGQARISISAQRKGDFFKFAFRDNGIGIAGPNAERVFAIFQRLNKQEDFEGLGVGLAYAKKIVDLHEGSIWFESQIGKGTTFYFTLKATENE